MTVSFSSCPVGPMIVDPVAAADTERPRHRHVQKDAVGAGRLAADLEVILGAFPGEDRHGGTSRREEAHRAESLADDPVGGKGVDPIA